MLSANQSEFPTRAARTAPLRILAVSEAWHGSDSYAYVRAMRRAGHSVEVLDAASFFAPGWQSLPLKIVRRLLNPLAERAYTQHLIELATRHRPHLLFAFKGQLVTSEALDQIKRQGAVAINFYPDVSITVHGPHLVRALGHYDWVFTAKTFGIDDMRRLADVTRASFMAPSFDPETHRPFKLDRSDMEMYDADASFIGTWSPKKEELLRHVLHAIPGIKLRIWGGLWQSAAPGLESAIQFAPVIGAEYAKCMRASRINLGLLSEQRAGSTSGDLITARTFQIPATGSFMLHERTDEIGRFFVEDEECALYSSPDDLVEKIRFYLANDSERLRIAEAGRARCLASGYSVDAKLEIILAKYREMVAERQN